MTNIETKAAVQMAKAECNRELVSHTINGSNYTPVGTMALDQGFSCPSVFNVQTAVGTICMICAGVEWFRTIGTRVRSAKLTKFEKKLDADSELTISEEDFQKKYLPHRKARKNKDK